MARPRIQLDEAQLARLEEMARFDCTVQSMADRIGVVSKRTLERNYGAVIAKGRAEAESELKGSLYRQAMKGNVTALIYLHKARYHMWDVPDRSVESSDSKEAAADVLATTRAMSEATGTKPKLVA